MAWVAPPTFVSGNVLTAAQMNILSGDLNETAAAKATAAGQYFVSTGANVLAARSAATAFISTAESTTASGASFVDLATVGPTCTVTSGTRALVTFGSQIENTTLDFGGIMTYGISGATTLAAPGTLGVLRLMSEIASPSAGSRTAASRVNFETALTAGSNTFTAKYQATTGGTASFTFRDMTVLPF